MERSILKLEGHLTLDDLKKIKILYGANVGNGCLEKCKNDALEILQLLCQKGCLTTDADLQILMDWINKPALLKGYNYIIIMYNRFYFEL